MSRDSIVELEQQLKDKGLLDEPLVKELMANYKDKAKTRYGLVWEDHTEQVHEELITGITNVSEYEDKRIVMDKDKPQNLLIEGDNLHGLMLLKDEGVKVDVIYIDPPYNTGNEFVYNDKIVDEDDGYRHSKWLSFMSKRLELAYDLLSEDGVIFVSIDDNEQANLKLLMDKIFGERNFVDSFMWLHGKGKKTRLSRTLQQYTVTYVKDYSRQIDWVEKKMPNYKFTNIDNDPKGPWFSGSISYSEVRSNKNSDNYFTIKSPSGVEWTRQWQEDKLKMLKLIEEGDIYWGTSPEYSNVPRRKIRNEPIEVIPNNIIDGVGTTRGATNELAEIIGDNLFDYPKPVELIKHLISITNKSQDITVLDFFAGSGTTAHAVMELNEVDGGTRQFILMTNNEVEGDKAFEIAKENSDVRQLLKDNGISIKPHKGSGMRDKNKQRSKDIEEFFHSGDGVDFFNSDIVQDEGICRKVTYERIRRVIEGDYANPRNNEDIKPLPNNLSYYKLDVEQDYDFKDEYKFRMGKSLLGLIAKEGTQPTKIDKYTYVFDRGNNEALVYDAGLYTKQSVVDEITKRFEGYSYEVISENNNADIKWKKLRKGDL